MSLNVLAFIFVKASIEMYIWFSILTLVRDTDTYFIWSYLCVLQEDLQVLVALSPFTLKGFTLYKLLWAVLILFLINMLEDEKIK